MTTRPFILSNILILDPSRYGPGRHGSTRRTVAMLRGIVIALILCVLAIPFVTEAEAGTLPQDASKQITTLRHQAAAGSATAQFQLGEVFQRGQHVPQDMTAAHHFYSLAATQGHIRAQFRLGFLYERGLGVKQDFALAARFYHRAARQNHAVAQHNLAILFAHGRGVKRNLQHAYGWARMAEINARQTKTHKSLSAGFHAKLDDLLSRLRTRLSTGQITRAEWHIQQASGIPT